MLLFWLQPLSFLIQGSQPKLARPRPRLVQLPIQLIRGLPIQLPQARAVLQLQPQVVLRPVQALLVRQVPPCHLHQQSLPTLRLRHDPLGGQTQLQPQQVVLLQAQQVQLALNPIQHQVQRPVLQPIPVQVLLAQVQVQHQVQVQLLRQLPLFGKNILIIQIGKLMIAKVVGIVVIVSGIHLRQGLQIGRC
jgi:hypothetical protein